MHLLEKEPFCAEGNSRAGGGAGVMHGNQGAVGAPAPGTQGWLGSVAWGAPLSELTQQIMTHTSLFRQFVHERNASGFEPPDPHSELVQTLRSMSPVRYAEDLGQTLVDKQNSCLL